MIDTAVTIYAECLQYVNDRVVSRLKPCNTGNGNGQVENYINGLFPQKEDLHANEILVLLIVLAPHLDPSFFDNLFVNIMGEGNFPNSRVLEENNTAALYLPAKWRFFF